VPARSKKREQTKTRKSQLARQEAYRQLVLESAERLFAEGGVDETRIEKIAREAGLAPGTLYSVFPSKAAIVGEIREGRGGELFRFAAERAAATDTALDRLLAFHRASLEFFLEHPDFLRIELNEGLTWTREPSGRNANWVRAFEGFARDIEHCIADGSVRSGDPNGYARALLALEQSQLAQWVEDGMKRDPQAVVEETIELVVRAFRA